VVNHLETHIPARTNFVLAGFHAGVNVYQFLIVPAVLLPLDARWAWTLLPLVFLNNSYWSLIHESIHDLFHPSRSINKFFGRAMSILFGSPLQIVRLSHLLHHKLNRTPKEATEVYDPRATSIRAAARGYYFQILGGLYLGELLSPLLFFLPRGLIEKFRLRFTRPDSVSGILMQNWSRPEILQEIRIDGILIVLWLSASCCFYASHWPLLLGILAARAFFISFLDNVYHYRTPVADIFYASNLRLPAPLRKLLLNFNLHGIHHRNPAIPWIRLPSVFREQSAVFHGSYLQAALSQLGGPIALEDLPQAAPRSNSPGRREENCSDTAVTILPVDARG
jgi:fatty acid desaturase